MSDIQSAMDAAANQADLRELNDVISKFEAVVLPQPEGTPRRAEGLCILGNTWGARYSLTSDDGDLQTAIRYTEQGVSATAADDASYATRLIQLGNLLSRRHDQTKSINDFQEATYHIQKALPFVPEDDPDCAKGHGTLGNLFSNNFKQTGHMNDLESAIQHTQMAFLLTPEDYPHRMDGQVILGDLLELRFERTQRLADLNAAISSIAEGVASTPESHPALAQRLFRMGDLLYTRYDRTGDSNDLDSAVRNKERAISIVTQANSDLGLSDGAQDGPSLSVWLADLGKCLARRYDDKEQDEDFETASLRIHQAISMTPEDDCNYATMVDYLGNLFSCRHEKTGSITDLESAIQYSKQVVSATTWDGSGSASRLGNFGSQLFSRYQVTSNKDDLDAAIEKTTQAAFTTSGHPDPAAMINNLGSMLQTRYELTGDLHDLEEAISNGRKAIQLTLNDDINLPGYLMNLSNALSTKYSRTGNTDDLNAAILHVEDAKKHMPEKHPKYVWIVFSLGNLLGRRHSRTGDIDDLTKALAYIKAAVHRSNKGNPEHVKYLNSLGCMLFSQYKENRNKADLETAISTIKIAMSLVRENNTEHLGCLSNLGNMLEARYRCANDMNDFDEAISATRRVLSATRKENPDFADWKYCLGRRLFERLVLKINHQISGVAPGSFEDAKQYMEQGFEDDIQSPEKAQIFWTLVKPLRDALNHQEEAGQRLPLVQDLLEALQSFKEATESLTAIPRMRVRAARGAVVAFEFLQEWDRACEVAREAVKLLPLVCGRHLNRKDQQHAIEDTSGVAAIACSLSLKTDRVEQALQQIEFGRGLILGYLIDNNSDISILRRDNLALANEFEELRSKAIKPIPIADPAIQQHAIEERTEAIQQLESCLERIRLMSGHERFLLEPAVGELLKGAADGPIVVVNITSISSDAIIVSQSGIKSIALPKMTPEKVSFLAQDFGRYSSAGQDDKDHDRDIQPETTSATKYSPEFLSWLWIDCVRPVLAELPRNSSSPAELPRIWWIGTGVASSFPFHAAGIHYQSGNEDTLSRAIPSYTPTIKALLHARSSAVKPASNQDLKTSVLVVTMPETSGHTSLPGVTAEASVIQNVTQANFKVNHLEKPSVALVMGEMGRSDIIHFACHGSSDRVDPSNSHLLLQPLPSSEASTGNLTLEQISDGQSAGKAKIAFLSACSTAEVRAGKFADEALHIVSAFQVVGFSHVIGSLWSVDDDTSVQVARVFYESLSHSNDQLTNRAVAEALRSAVMKVRDGVEPRVWASYVHFGA